MQKIKIDKNNVERVYNLTMAQVGILVETIRSQAKMYNQYISVRLKGEMDINILLDSCEILAQRHEMLRTVFRWRDIREAVQIVLKKKQLPVTIFKVSDSYDDTKHQSYDDIRSQIMNYDINLETDPFRLCLVCIEDGCYEMVLIYHHILFDGWSSAILVRDLLNIYHSMIFKKQPLLPEKCKYKEYVDYFMNIDGYRLDQANSFWKTYFSDVSIQGKYYIRKIRGKDNFKSYSRQLDAKLFQEINQYANDNNITISVFFYAMWGLFLSRDLGLNDVVYLTAQSVRPKEIRGIDNAAGLYINTIPVRIKVRDEDKIETFLADMKKNIIQIMSKNELSLSQIINNCSTPTEIKNMSMFVVENYPLERMVASIQGESKLEISEFNSVEYSEFPLMVQIMTQMEPAVNFTYNEAYFSAAKISFMYEKFYALIVSIIRGNEKNILKLDLVPSGERLKTVLAHSSEFKPMKKYKSVLLQFLLNVKNHPNDIALEMMEKRFTYSELNNLSDKIVCLFKEYDINEGSVIGIRLKRSEYLIASLIAVFKMKCSFLPLDMTMPQKRVETILNQAQPKVVLTQGQREEYLLAYSIISLNNIEGCVGTNQAAVDSVPEEPCGNAYIMYTSGSTGQPKGVVVTQRNLSSFIQNVNEILKFNFNERILCVTTVSFDIFMLEVMLPLCIGARIVLASESEQRDPKLLSQLIFEKRVSVIQFTPTRMQLFLGLEGAEKILHNVRNILIGGEVFPDILIDKLESVSKAKIYNMYGPTETTVYSCVKRMNNVDEITIGKPICNTLAYVLDDYGNPMPTDMVGELYLSGDGVAKEYYKSPDLTEKKFLSDPFIKGNVMFRTGDIAKWNCDGELVLYGRIDNQVKIKGYRIELEEIENVLCCHPSIREAAAYVVPDSYGNNSLHVAINSSETLNSAGIFQFLKGRLPQYMVPESCCFIEEIPKTIGGKIDRNSLVKAHPSLTQGTTTKRVLNGKSQQKEIQNQVLRACRAVFGSEDIKENDNFFDIGGNSYLMVRLSEKLREFVGIDVSVTNLLEYPNIRAIVEWINGQKAMEEFSHEENGMEEDLIAVIGMAGRFPYADSVNEYWENLVAGRECIISALEAGDGLQTSFAPVIDIDKFDSEFFDVTPREAQLMDPQHRIFLECCYHALEDAGYNSSKYSGDISVFASCGLNMYMENILRGKTLESEADILSTYIANDKDFIATRVCYKLGLKGAGISIQTACSSSLVSVHMACQSLLTSECDMALAGGISIKIPQEGIPYQEGGIISGSGHCRAFDDSADGTVTGNGAGVVVLKRLSRAEADKDHIYAVIRSSAINNDSNSKVGYTAPSIERQTAVIRRAMSKGNVSPKAVSYIETHGTGTVLGDSAEFAALSKVYKGLNLPENSLAIGSVKTNIGHTDVASGICGLIKTILMLNKRLLVPSLNFNMPNKLLDFTDVPFYINTQLKEWGSSGGKRTAAVSSFGIGGTNAHVILEEYKNDVKENEFFHREQDLESREQILLLSARSWDSLEGMANNLSSFLLSEECPPLCDVAYTLQVGRKHHELRYFQIAGTKEEAGNLFKRDIISKQAEVVGTKEQPHIVFAFPGLNAQTEDAGRQIYEQLEPFKRIMDEKIDIIRSILPEFLVFGEEGQKDPTDKTLKKHLLTFTLEYALAELLIEWGIYPDSMIGYSLGEYVAACIAGTVEFTDAVRIIIQRFKSIETCSKGRMIAVGASYDVVCNLLVDGVYVSAVNSPVSTVVSGTKDSINKFLEKLSDKQIASLDVNVEYPYHSSYMEPARHNLLYGIKDIKFDKPRIPYVSGRTGKIVGENEINAEYWFRHINSKVQFAAGIETLLKEPKKYLVVEIGWGQFLSGLIMQNSAVNRKKIKIMRTLDTSGIYQSEWSAFLGCLGKLWKSGLDFDWGILHEGKNVRRVSLPLYPFRKVSHWIKNPVEREKNVILKPNEPLSGAEQKEYMPPQTLLEEEVAHIWSSVLGYYEISIYDNWFELGGDSLQAIKLGAMLRDELRVRADVGQLYLHPTIHEMSKMIEDMWGGAENANKIITAFRKLHNEKS